MIYLDNAATSGKKPEAVLQAINKSMTELSVNAGRGSYALARKATSVVDECREKILRTGKIRKGYHTFFSPSATIAFNQIILGLKMDQYSNVYASVFEHNAIMRPLFNACSRQGSALIEFAFTEDNWLCDWEKLEDSFITRKPEYVFISMVSNTTGFILPVKDITRLAHKYGARVIVDCAQALGAIEADLQDIGADAYVFAGHKTLLGPYGIAGFILKDDWNIDCGLFGGTGSDSLNLKMPSPLDGGYEPGSLNLPAICGLSAACDWIEEFGIGNIQEHERHLTYETALELSRNAKVRLYYPPEDKASSILAFNVEGYKSHEVGSILDEEFDIAVRTGFQCAPWAHHWLHTEGFGGIVRCSVSCFNTIDDVNQLIQAIATF